MRTSAILPSLMLFTLADYVSSSPLIAHHGLSNIDIWVTKSNTLNATSWGSGSDSNAAKIQNTADSSSSVGAVVPTSSQVANQTNNSLDNVNRPLNTTVQGQNGVNSSATGPTTNSSNRNGTSHDAANATTKTNAVSGNGALTMQFINRMPSSNAKAYVSGLSPSGTLVMLGQNGQWVYPSTTSSTPQAIAGNVAIPLGAPNSTTTMTLPGFISSARIWFVDGNLQFFVVSTPSGPGLVEPAVANPKDPNSEANWGFAELTWTANSGLYADITAVDFVGLPLGIKLQDTDDKTYSALGLPSNAAPALCDVLVAQQNTDGWPWSSLCEYNSDHQLMRVLSPSNYLSQNPSAFGTYFGWYINDVWDHYTSNDLIIDTQTTPGNVTCRVHGSELTCAGDNRGYAKPNNFDIFGCDSGPFAIESGDNNVHLAIVPRLCAAFNRATLLLPGGNVQPSLPPSRYYTDDDRAASSRPRNHYSEAVHTLEAQGRGYAFSYDDVAPSIGEDQSGLVASNTPKVLTIFVGGM